MTLWSGGGRMTDLERWWWQATQTRHRSGTADRSELKKSVVRAADRDADVARGR
uniref:Uncharacterized protein n=1 Tax=Kalanchoe fedtschenkoi TaxID=63787 RepID=A0A7N0THZ3_KALFE